MKAVGEGAESEQELIQQAFKFLQVISLEEREEEDMLSSDLKIPVFSRGC